jgi:multidrug efflux pump subunit AcrB
MSSAEALETAAHGSRSRDAAVRHELRVVRADLPAGHQGSLALLVYPLCVLFVFLVLAALYESWTLPLAVILIVPLCLLAAIGGTWLINFSGTWAVARDLRRRRAPPTFLDNNIFTQVGLVVLMGLACKNAILIVEFARELEHQGATRSMRQSRLPPAPCARS